MKITKVYEVECMRHNVTPGQFLAYVRSQCKKHGGNMEYSAAEFARDGGWNSSYNDELPDGRTGAEAERVIDKPYEKNTYIANHDGTVYNQIIEFDFWDEKTGTGYYYELQTDVRPEDKAANVRESIEGIAARAERKAERLEILAAHRLAEIDEWTVKSYAEAERGQAELDKRDAATLREKAREARENVEKYIALYTGQEEAQKAQEEADMAYYIPETGETVTAGELAADLIASGDSPETAREIIRGMAAELAIMPADGSEPLPASDLPGRDWLTAENIEILREALRQARADYEADPSAFHVRISRGNGKMGRVPSISILPVLFCPACCLDCNGCGHICYALKLAVIRASVRRSWAINTAIMLADWAKYWAEIREALAGCEFFRFHVSGEIAGRRYFREMISAAEDFPGCQILCFTKQFETVNAQIDETGALPVNLKLLFSGMPGRRPHNPHNLPETTIILKGTPDSEIPSTWRICPGQCESCAARNIGCWLAQPGDIIAFHQH